MASDFGNTLREIRLELDISLREFCVSNGFDPGNYSRIERGSSIPTNDAKIEEILAALKIERESEQWQSLMDLAAACRGELPKDIKSDEQLLAKLPAVFRTIRSKKTSQKDLEKLIETIRRG